SLTEMATIIRFVAPYLRGTASPARAFGRTRGVSARFGHWSKKGTAVKTSDPPGLVAIWPSVSRTHSPAHTLASHTPTYSLAARPEFNSAMVPLFRQTVP